MILMCTGVVAGCSSNQGSASSSSAGSNNAASLPHDSGGTASGGSGSAQSGGTSATGVQNTADLIVMAGLQLAVGNPEQAASQAEQTVLNAGGYIAAESEGVGPQALPSATTTADGSESTVTGVSPMTLPPADAAADSNQALLLMRVPPQRLDGVLTALGGAGRVSYRTRSETDVTGQVADVASRITSAQASLTELRGLINKAASMNDLISLEQALSSRESDLESLEAQQRALSDQVQYATVTVGFYQPAQAAAPKPAPHRTGFVAALADGWHALWATIRGLLILLGWVLPFAVPIALLWWLARRLRGRMWGRPAAEAAVAPALKEEPEPETV